MFTPSITTIWSGCVALFSLLISTSGSAGAEARPTSHVASVSVFAPGLNNPRGLKFGPGGYLYVAEGRIGGGQSTVGRCEQVPPPVGPYTGSSTGARSSAISPAGVRIAVLENLPSSQTARGTGSFVSGVADIAFVGPTLYALLAGAGCSHGVPDVPNGVLQLAPDSGTTLVADLSAFQQANPVANPEPDDFEPDGSWYSMVGWRGALYALEPNHGELDRISRDGQISRVIDTSASQRHVVPTALAAHRDRFYVGTLTPFPAAPVARVYRISPEGEIRVVAESLTAVTGIAFEGDQLDVLETSAAAKSPGPPVLPGTGRVVRVTRSGALEPVVTGLTFPTVMTFGTDRHLYISNFGFGFPPGYGQILEVELLTAKKQSIEWRPSQS